MLAGTLPAPGPLAEFLDRPYGSGDQQTGAIEALLGALSDQRLELVEL